MALRPRALVAAAFVAAAAIAGMVACVTNPVTGERDFVLMTEDQEIEAGKRSDPQIRAQYGVYDDSALQAYVQRVGAALATRSHRPQLHYHFTVLDSDEVNAFALPGGYVYITRGILAYLNSEAELAAVLGHEIGHVNARHSVRQISAATAGGAIIQWVGGGALAQQVLGIIHDALLSGYGREHELQADHLGAEYIARVGYDPQAMLGVMGVLKNQEQAEHKRAAAEGREPRIYHGVFASHPSADQRLQEVIADARKFKTGAAVRVGREEYLKRVDALVFGDSVAQGIRRGSNFYHRDLDLAVHFPDGWRLQNTAAMVIARAPRQEAIMQLIVEDIAKDVTAGEYLHSRAKAARYRDERALEGAAVPAHTAIVQPTGTVNGRSVRLVVLIHRHRAITLAGFAQNDAAFGEFDAVFLGAARSLHSLNDKERVVARGWRLRLITTKPGTTFAQLAQRSPLSDFAELTLRLINDKFPNGEPTPEQPTKIIE